MKPLVALAVTALLAPSLCRAASLEEAAQREVNREGAASPQDLQTDHATLNRMRRCYEALLPGMSEFDTKTDDADAHYYKLVQQALNETAASPTSAPTFPALVCNTQSCWEVGALWQAETAAELSTSDRTTDGSRSLRFRSLSGVTQLVNERGEPIDGTVRNAQERRDAIRAFRMDIDRRLASRGTDGTPTECVTQARMPYMPDRLVSIQPARGTILGALASEGSGGAGANVSAYLRATRGSPPSARVAAGISAGFSSESGLVKAPSGETTPATPAETPSPSASTEATPPQNP